MAKTKMNLVVADGTDGAETKRQPKAVYLGSTVIADQLRSVVERVERLEEEKAGIAADIREVFAEAKGNGFDVKTLRQIIRLRKMEASEREEAAYLLDVYMRALGMQPDLFDVD